MFEGVALYEPITVLRNEPLITEGRTLLIDGDIMAHRVSASKEVETDWGDDYWTLHCDFSECRAKVIADVDSMVSLLKADTVVFCFSPKSTTFRYDIYEAYKSNRKGRRKPVCYNELRDFIKESWLSFEIPYLEADDVLGILNTGNIIIGGEKIIVSIDKDMRTIPGLVYDLRHAGEVLEITEAAADCTHMQQTLTGDTSDGYPGCPGIGAKRAGDLLFNTDMTYETMWPLVVAEFQKKGLTESDALIQARLARILRVEDYDFENQVPLMWSI